MYIKIKLQISTFLISKFVPILKVIVLLPSHQSYNIATLFLTRIFFVCLLTCVIFLLKEQASHVPNSHTGPIMGIGPVAGPTIIVCPTYMYINNTAFFEDVLIR